MQEPESNRQNGTDPVRDITIPLLAERLVIDRHKRKVGEVVVRKEVVTEVIEVLVRREKLVVEQLEPEFRQLAEIDMGERNYEGLAHTEVQRKFTSLRDAHEFLELIASQPTLDVRTINISIELRPDF